jgi:hypothetical protein
MTAPLFVGSILVWVDESWRCCMHAFAIVCVGCGPAQPGLKRTASTTQIPVKATPRQTEQGQKPQIKKGGK